MPFYEAPVFPDTISYSATGGPQFSTSVITAIGGVEQANQNWAQDRMTYEIGLINRTADETKTLLAFFRAVAKGRANGFRFNDFLAGENLGTDEPIGTGDGADVTFQLLKRYAATPLLYDRTITKPVTGTVTIKLNGVPTGAFTVNTATGLVTMTSPPAGGVAITASFSFHVPVKFGTDILQIQRLEPNVYNWPSVQLLETRSIT